LCHDIIIIIIIHGVVTTTTTIGLAIGLLRGEHSAIVDPIMALGC